MIKLLFGHSDNPITAPVNILEYIRSFASWCKYVWFGI